MNYLNWPPLIKAVLYDIWQLIPIIIIDMLLQFVISAIYRRKTNIHKWVATENFEARCSEVNIKRHTTHLPKMKEENTLIISVIDGPQTHGMIFVIILFCFLFSIIIIFFLKKTNYVISIKFNVLLIFNNSE
jgi:hypothetical protein